MLDNFYVFKTIVYTFLSSHGIGGILTQRLLLTCIVHIAVLARPATPPAGRVSSKPITLSEREDRQVKLLQNYENNLPPQSWRL